MTGQDVRPGRVATDPDQDLLEQILAGIRRPTDAVGLPVTDLGLSTRTTNALRREGVHTVEQLLGWTEVDLMDIRPLGLGSVAAIVEALAGHDWKLREYVPGRSVTLPRQRR